MFLSTLKGSRDVSAAIFAQFLSAPSAPSAPLLSVAMGQIVKNAGKTKKKIVPSRLLYRGKCDRAVVKRATAMTREEWQKHRVGKDTKWPLPEYMIG